MTEPHTPTDPATELFGAPTATQPVGSADPALLARPRIRVGAIVWGVLLFAIAALTLWVTTDPARERAFSNWFAGLPEGAAGLLLLLVVGALLLLWGALAAIRRSQERGVPRL
ncbi:hypothetical protein ACFFGH_33720 [Lysobacter korlensis]|uniref:Uncharacterized protein n=1 Tax=Lysobacter korlensis TaxID=553636 RepID=A0ABV6S0R8_9GAMM